MISEPIKISDHGVENGILHFKVHFLEFPEEYFEYLPPDNLKAPEIINQYCESIGLVGLTPSKQIAALKKLKKKLNRTAEMDVKALKIVSIVDHKISEENAKWLYVMAEWSNGEVVRTRKSCFRGAKPMLISYLKEHDLFEKYGVQTPATKSKKRPAKGISKIISKNKKTTASTSRRKAAPRKFSAVSEAKTPTTSRIKATKNRKTPGTAKKYPKKNSKGLLLTLADIIANTNTKLERAQSLPPRFPKAPPLEAFADIPMDASDEAPPASPLFGGFHFPFSPDEPMDSPSASESSASPPGTSGAATVIPPEKIIAFQNYVDSRCVRVSAGDSSEEMVVSVEEYRKHHNDAYIRQLEEFVYDKQ